MIVRSILFASLAALGLCCMNGYVEVDDGFKAEFTVEKTIEEIEIVEIEEWTTYYEEFNTECDAGESMESTELMKDPATADVSMACSCSATQEVEESMATKTRYTEFVDIRQMTEHDGCYGDESLAGILSQMDGETRLICFKCVEESNAIVIRESITEVVHVVTEIQTVADTTLLTETTEYEDMVVCNMYFEYVGTTVNAHYYYAQYEYTEDTKFDEDIIIDQTQTQAEERLEETEDINEVEEDESTEAEEDFNLECDANEAISSSEMAIDEDTGDVIMTTHCSTTITEESTATITRITEYTDVLESTEDVGCVAPDETVCGMLSQYNDGHRYVALICKEMSNAIVDEETITEVTQEITEEGMTMEAPSEGMVLSNCFFTMIGEKMYATYQYGEYSYTSESKFEESGYIDETIAQTSEENACLCLCGNVCYDDGTHGGDDSSGEDSKKRKKRSSMSTVSTKTTYITKTVTRVERKYSSLSSSIHMEIETEERDGVMAYTLVPSQYIELCPEDICECGDCGCTATTQAYDGGAGGDGGIWGKTGSGDSAGSGSGSGSGSKSKSSKSKKSKKSKSSKSKKSKKSHSKSKKSKKSKSKGSGSGSGSK